MEGVGRGGGKAGVTWMTMTLTCHLLFLQLTMAKRMEARRLTGIDHNPW